MQIEGASIGARVDAARRRRGMTSKALAQASGLDEGHVSRIQRDIITPGHRTMIKLAIALGVKTADLIPDLPEPVEAAS